MYAGAARGGVGDRRDDAITVRCKIGAAAGVDWEGSSLAAKRVIDKTLPYSARPHPKLSRYHVCDPYLRFWLRFMRASIPKWRSKAKLDESDVERLIAHREMLPGADADTLLVGISRTGFATERLDVALGVEGIVGREASGWPWP